MLANLVDRGCRECGIRNSECGVKCRNAKKSKRPNSNAATDTLRGGLAWGVASATECNSVQLFDGVCGMGSLGKVWVEGLREEVRREQGTENRKGREQRDAGSANNWVQRGATLRNGMQSGGETRRFGCLGEDWRVARASRARMVGGGRGAPGQGGGDWGKRQASFFLKPP